MLAALSDTETAVRLISLMAVTTCSVSRTCSASSPCRARLPGEIRNPLVELAALACPHLPIISCNCSMKRLMPAEICRDRPCWSP